MPTAESCLARAPTATCCAVVRGPDAVLWEGIDAAHAVPCLDRAGLVLAVAILQYSSCGDSSR